jgi:hypothetical protein
MKNPLIILNENSLKSDVFYGSININGTHISVSNLTELGKEYRFRYTAKARAGFPVIADVECKVEALPYYLSKNTTVVEVERMIGGKSYWFHILTTKGGKWYSIDKNLLESLTVGDMHGMFSKMIDWNIWKRVNAKFHSCKSFVPKALIC